MNKSIQQVGFWSAILVAVFTIWFTIAFAPYMATLQWNGIESFARSFDPAPYVAWVLPCLLLALTFGVLLSAIHFYTPAERKIWSWLGLLFAIMYGAILTTNYWVLLTVVRDSLTRDITDGLAWFVIGSPNSITNSLEGIGYGFMGLATFFAGWAFAGDRLEHTIRWVWVVNGIAGIAGVVLGGLGIIVATMVSLAVWCITFPVGMALVAVLFWRSKIIA